MNTSTRPYIGPHSHQPSGGGKKLIILAVVFAFLATLFVALRFWVRRLKRKGPFLEDWILLVALVCQPSFAIPPVHGRSALTAAPEFSFPGGRMGLCGDMFPAYGRATFIPTFLEQPSLMGRAVALNGGIGWPDDQIAPEVVERTMKYSLAGQTSWPIANGLVKLSICLTFIRVFFVRGFRICATIVYSLSLGWSVATMLVGYLICSPISKLWDLTAAGHCGDQVAAYITLGVLDVILDIAVYMLPIPMIYRLQVPLHTKIALATSFALGLLTILASVMRLVAVIQIDFAADFVEGQVSDAYWCAIEVSVGIIVASSIVMRPLLERMPSLFGRFSSWGKSLVGSDRTPSQQSLKANGHRVPEDGGSFVRLHCRLLPESTPDAPSEQTNYTSRPSYEFV
ncbi:MAG: hypothetical protein Q9163_003327 [Psora crenata]